MATTHIIDKSQKRRMFISNRSVNMSLSFNISKIIKIMGYWCKNRYTDQWYRKGNLGKEVGLYKKNIFHEHDR